MSYTTLETTPLSISLIRDRFNCTVGKCTTHFATLRSLKVHVRFVHTTQGVRCSFCNLKTFNQQSHDRHVDEFHCPDEPLKCKKCGKFSKTIAALWRHVRESHRGSKFICTVCNGAFTRPENLKVHMKQVHSDNKKERVECRECGKTFLDKPQMRKHVRINHRDLGIRFHCPEKRCRKEFKEEKARDRHVKWVHQLGYSFKCDICNMSFKSKTHLKRHCEGTTHKENVQLSPSSRSKLNRKVKRWAAKRGKGNRSEYEDDNNVEESEEFEDDIDNDNNNKTKDVNDTSKNAEDFLNRRKENPKEITSESENSSEDDDDSDDDKESEESDSDVTALHYCMYCDESFKSLSSVQTHEFNCGQEKKSKKYPKCSTCGKKCTSQHTLKQHMLVHMNERPFKCPFCPLTYKSKNSRKNHADHMHRGKPSIWEKIKDKLIPVRCDQCGKMMSCEKNLKRHMLEVHNENSRLFKCQYCPKSFKRSLMFREHVKYEHESKKRHRCDICKTSFSRENKLLAHLKRKRHLKKVMRKARGEPVSGRRKHIMVVEDVSEEEEVEAVVIKEEIEIDDEGNNHVMLEI